MTKEMIVTQAAPIFKYVPGKGPPSKLIIVAEAPGEQEVEAGRPLVGPSGQETEAICRMAGFSLDSVYRTNVFKYRPPGNDFKRHEETGHTLKEQQENLWKEIRQIQDAGGSNCILALGAVAFHSLVDGSKNLNYCRGSIYLARDGHTKVVATHHPARLLPSREPGKMLPYSARFIMKLDFKRALDESRTSSINLPNRLLTFAKSSLDLYRFIEQYSDKSIVSLDIESIRSIPVCLGLAFNSFYSISVPLLDIPSKFSLPDHEKVEIIKLLTKLFAKPGLKIIGQNWKFDADKLDTCFGWSLPDPWFDLSFATHCLYPEFPKSLDFQTSVFTREPYYKSELKEFNIKRDKIEDLFLYNAKDVAVPFEIYEVLSRELEEAGLTEYFFKYYMPLHKLYMSIERTGFDVDENVRKNLKIKYDALELDLQCKLDAIAGYNVNVNSPKQLALYLYGPESVCKFPVRTSRKTGNITADESTLTALQANQAKTDNQRRSIDNILGLRQVKKTKSTYVLFRKDYDGKCRTSFQICGAETGRSSTQLLNPPVRPHKIGLTFHNITSHSDIGADLKSMLCAPDGYVIGNADLSQAEPRIVCVLSENFELLGQFGQIDVHKKMAGICFEVSPEEAQSWPKEDPRRFVGKTMKNATNYDAGKHQAMVTVNTDAKKYGIPLDPISEWKAGKMLERLHAADPKLRAIFHKGIQEKIQKTRTLYDPFGGRRLFFGRMDEQLYKEAYAHIPQRTVITQLRQAMIRAKERYDIQFVNEHHDAAAWICKPEEFEEIASIVREELMKPINFKKCSLSRDFDLVIPSDIEWGVNYGAQKKDNPLGMRKWKGEKIVL